MSLKKDLGLSDEQDAWLRSTAKREAISIASVVRGMIDSERNEPERDYDADVVKGDDSMSQPGHPLHTTRGRNACRFSDGWSAFDGGFYPNGTPRRALTEAQAIAWCLKGVLP